MQGQVIIFLLSGLKSVIRISSIVFAQKFKEYEISLVSLVVNSQQLYEKHRQFIYSDELRVECNS